MPDPDVKVFAQLMNLRKVGETHPAVLVVMYLSAFLHPDKIPFEIFTEYFPVGYQFPEGKDRTWIEKEVLPTLGRWVLLRLDLNERTARTDEKTSDAVRLEMRPDERRAHVEGLLNAMNRLIPAYKPGVSFELYNRLDAHVRVLLHHSIKCGLNGNAGGQELVKKVVDYLQGQDKVDDANAFTSSLLAAVKK